MRICIIGYGNTLRSDDGLGVYAAHLLTQHLPESFGQVATCTQVTACQQLGPELVEDLQAAELVIFIDAGCDTPPGQISFKPVQPRETAPVGVSHHFSPDTLLALCHAFYGRAPEAWLYSVGAASFDLGEAMTPTVEQVLPDLIQKILWHIQEYKTLKR